MSLYKTFLKKLKCLWIIGLIDMDTFKMSMWAIDTLSSVDGHHWTNLRYLRIMLSLSVRHTNNMYLESESNFTIIAAEIETVAWGVSRAY